MKRNGMLLSFVVLFVAVLVAGCAPKAGQVPTAALPAGKAWAEGKEIFFVHTEASDAGVAEKLTAMMKSPVLLVPSLAKMPADALAQVYVFTNGVAGKGPFGFQADVFPNPPGTEGYSPLRNINAVTWADPAKARELKSVAEVMTAKDAGEVTIEQPGVVVNMPFVVWDGGETLNMEPIVLAFITGLTTGGLSCLAVQGGLLAGSIASEIEQSVQNQPASVQRVKVGTAPQPQQMQPRASRPILLFLTAKLIAYTLLGFMLGWVGAVLQLTPMMRAILLTGIGIFMIGSALRMLNIHPIFRYFLIEPPSSVTRYIRRKSKGQANALTPLFLGALTVLIPCGVTQAMMAVAMGTGNPWTGAAIMFAFVLGTSPVFFTVAYLTTRLGARLEKNFVRIVAVILLVLGLVSIDSGLTLAGFPYSVANLRMTAGGSEPPVAAAQPQVQEVAPQPQVQNPAPVQDQKPLHDTGKSDLTGAFGPAAAAAGVVTINVKNDGYQPEVTHAKPNQPFQLALVTNETYSCARAFVIQSLGIEKVLPATGTVTVDIPAQPAGSKLFYSCSMGMYSGVIVFDS